jgi:hypothetical protein
MLRHVTICMTEVVETKEDGTRKVIVTDSKVITGTVERVTGAGNVIVYPSQHDPDLKKGEEALIVTDKEVVQKVDIGLEIARDHVLSPYPSDFAVIVKSRTRSLERCSVYLDGTQLSTLDSTGHPVSELPLPNDGWLSFHVPQGTPIRPGSSVELRDGDIVVMRQTVESLPGSALI